MFTPSLQVGYPARSSDAPPLLIPEFQRAGCMELVFDRGSMTPRTVEIAR